MKISVVTVCLNSERTIAQTIESFLSQTYADKELLIVDGVSRDRTLEIVNSFGSKAIRVFCERDSGIYDAMNKGLRLFSGDAVGFLGSDDTFHSSGALDTLAEGLQSADVVYGNLHVVRDHISKRVVRTFRPGPYHRRAFQRGWFPPHPTFYVRRPVVEAVGSFDTKYKIGADYDYVLRTMALHQFSSRYIPQVLVDFQAGGASSRGLFRSVLVHSLEALDSRRRRLGASTIDAALFLKPARSLIQVRWFTRN
jgi:glycosyltransferase involved in cell wall biosynthesis